MKYWLVVPAAAFLSGCGSANLTREQAAVIITKSPLFSDGRDIQVQINPALREAVWQCGVKAGLWRLERRIITGSQGVFTPKGQAIVKYAELGHSGMLLEPSESSITFKRLQRVNLGVTGLAEGQNPKTDKIAEFTWQWVMPEAIAPCLSAPPTSSEAYLRLYDDGWRLEKIE